MRGSEGTVSSALFYFTVITAEHAKTAEIKLLNISANPAISAVKH